MSACRTITTAPASGPRLSQRMDAIGLAEPALRRPYPRVDPDPAIHFHNWLTTGAIDGQNDGTPYLSYFAYEKTFWDARTREQPALRALQRSAGGSDRGDAEDCGLPRDRNFRCRVEPDGGLGEFRVHAQGRGSSDPGDGEEFRRRRLASVEQGSIGTLARPLSTSADVELFDKKLRDAVPDVYADWLLAGRIAGSGVDPSRM